MHKILKFYKFDLINLTNLQILVQNWMFNLREYIKAKIY